MSEVDPLDLSNLQMLPDWVKQPQENPKFKEEPVRPPGGKGKGGGRGSGRGGAPGPYGDRRDSGGGRGRDARRPGGGPHDKRSGDANDKRGGNRRDNRGGGPQDKRGGNWRDNRDRPGRPPQAPLPSGVSLSFQPAKEGVAFIAQQIKTSGCAYPVFDLARLILNNRDRYSLIFDCKEGAKLFVCKLDQSLWLNREEAVAHATSCKEFGDYYREEKVSVDPPKGNFSSIAVCGLSGELLGPPNHHSYQENIVRIHAERFPRMHIDGFKRKIKIERDDEIVEKWKEQQSTQSHFTLLKGEEGAEPVILKSRLEAIRHFSQNYASALIQEVGKATLPGDVSGRQLAAPLFDLLRQEGERLRKFPMDLVQRLCRAFEKQGLKFFKEGKKTTYVARLRPRPIANEEEFSDGIRKIVAYVRDHPNTKLNDLAGALIPESKRSSPPRSKRQQQRRPKQRDPAKAPAAEAPAAEAPTVETPTVETPTVETPAVQTPAAEAPAAEAPAAETPAAETPAAETPAAETPAAEAPAAETPAAETPAAETPAAEAPAAEAPAAETPAVETPAVETPAVEAQSVEAQSAEAAAAENPAAETPAAEAPAAAERSASEPGDVKDPVAAEAKPPAAPAPPPLTPEEIAVLQDLRWLIREGYVIEFSNGTLKLPRPHDPPKKKAAKQKQVSATPSAAPGSGEPAPPPPPEQVGSEQPERKPDPTPTSPPPRA